MLNTKYIHRTSGILGIIALAGVLIAGGCSKQAQQKVVSLNAENRGSDHASTSTRDDLPPMGEGAEASDTRPRGVPPVGSGTSTRPDALKGDMVTGKITENNATDIAIKLEDGTTKKIMIVESTKIQNFGNSEKEMTKLSVSDLSIGDGVSILGSMVDDLFTAKMIGVGRPELSGNSQRPPQGVQKSN